VTTDAPQNGDGGHRVGLNEKRRDPRIQSLLTVWCETELLTAFGRVLNFSRSGLYIVAPCDLENGDIVTISHEDEATDQFFATPAQVVWRRLSSVYEPRGMGVHFTDPIESARLYEVFRVQNEKIRQKAIVISDE